jgi:hypothetical protein
MNIDQAELYERIQAFSLDNPDAQLSFSNRLARDNGWSLEYTRQAIEEYQKFAFLAVAAGHPVTPSDQVDQVWHLHLTYTRSYWEEFCSQVLKTPLHHEPTSGGQSENQKFNDWYSQTLESYEQFFGQTPPVEIWPTPKDRFERDLSFVRINTQQNWVFSKLQVQKGATVSILVLLTSILSGCYVNSSENNVDPFGGTLLAAMCVAAGFGAIRFLVGIVDVIKNPSRPSSRGDWGGSGCGTGGCGNSCGGCGGCCGCGGGGCGGCS